MGYNGLGLQKWLYKQKPRRPYTKDRKLSSDIADYHHDSDIIKDILTKKGPKRVISDNDSNRASKRLEKRNKDRNDFLIIKRILISVLFATAIGLLIAGYTNSYKPKDRNKEFKNGLATTYCKKADVFFNNGNFINAHLYYRKALTYNPDYFEAYHGLALTYGNLCDKKVNHCINALNLVSKIRKKFPDKDINDLFEMERMIKINLEL